MISWIVFMSCLFTSADLSNSTWLRLGIVYWPAKRSIAAVAAISATEARRLCRGRADQITGCIIYRILYSSLPLATRPTILQRSIPRFNFRSCISVFTFIVFNYANSFFPIAYEEVYKMIPESNRLGRAKVDFIYHDEEILRMLRYMIKVIWRIKRIVYISS